MSNSDRFEFRNLNLGGPIAHVLKINLRAKGLGFVTNRLPYFPIKTSDFAVRLDVTYAINADQFYSYTNGEVLPYGLYASGGIGGGATSSEPSIYISKKNEVSIKRPKTLWNVVSGSYILINNGKIVPDVNGYIFPRTAIGWNDKIMFWVVVDGNEADKTGISLSALSIFMKSLGCKYAMNMDGGGSSTMVYNDRKGNVSILNVPSDDNIPGKERPVANCLGVR